MTRLEAPVLIMDKMYIWLTSGFACHCLTVFFQFVFRGLKTLTSAGCIMCVVLGGSAYKIIPRS
ncbi:unnamed protein product [Tenebrio molitor]|nr:unnamed protein product [Tenebrio molitor]